MIFIVNEEAIGGGAMIVYLTDHCTVQVIDPKYSLLSERAFILRNDARELIEDYQRYCETSGYANGRVAYLESLKGKLNER